MKIHHAIVCPVTRAEETIRWFLFGIKPGELVSHVEISYMIKIINGLK